MGGRQLMSCTQPTRQHGPAILVVDDELEVRVVVAEFLQDLGYSVLRADTGVQALALLREQPAIDLLLTDVRMPLMSGIELANRAAERYPLLKIILMSGYSGTSQMNRRFLRKPFRMKELEAAVRAELAAPC